MTEVIIRYGCDGGCGRYFDSKDELNRVDIQQFRGLNNGQPIYFTDRFELWCPSCTDKKRLPEDERKYQGPKITNPGFKVVNGG